MVVPARKLNNLVLNRRTVSRPDPLDLPAIQRRALHVAANNIVNPFIGPREVAADSILKFAGRSKRECGGLGIAILLFDGPDEAECRSSDGPNRILYYECSLPG